MICAAGPGTRAGLHGQTLISTGHADLDRVLGGGLPLGALLLILEDAASPHATTLLRCFAAEGVACGHQVLWAAGGEPPPGGLAETLPAYARVRGAAKVCPGTAPEAHRQFVISGVSCEVWLAA